MDRFRNLTILCIAIATSIVLVNLVLIFLLSSGSTLSTELPKPVTVAVFAASLVLLASAPAVKGAVFKRADAEGFEGDPDRRFVAYQTAYIVAFAMREAAGLLGFMLALMTGNPWWSWGLGGAALISMIFDWPKPEAIGWDQTPGPK